MDRSRLADVCEALPLFPLPRVVLMPRDLLPLHVFEPRYRALVAHCAAGDRVMGVATLQPGHEEQYAGAPPLYEEVGIGLMVAHQALPDGRSNIVLQWLARATILGELATDHPFRIVRAALREDTDLEAPLAGLRSLVVQLGSYSETAAEEARRIAALSGSALVDELARRMLEEPDDRRRYVATDSVAARARMLEERLAGIVAGGAPTWGDA